MKALPQEGLRDALSTSTDLESVDSSFKIGGNTEARIFAFLWGSCMLDPFSKSIQGQPNLKSFKLVRCFTIASLSGFAIAAIALGLDYQRYILRTLIEQGEEQNIVLTRSSANSLWKEFAGFLTATELLSDEELRNHPLTRQLHRRALQQMEGLSAIDINIYDFDGRIIFSTENERIGDLKADSEGFETASRGEILTQVEPNNGGGREEASSHRKIVSSYIPIYHPPLAIGEQMTLGDRSKQIAAVFELASDITPLVAKAHQTQQRLMVEIFMTLGPLLGLLLWFLHRTNQVLLSQYSALRATLDSTADGILVLNNAGDITHFNRKLAEIWDLDLPCDSEQMLKEIAQQLADTRQFSVQGWFRKQLSQPERYDVLRLKNNRIVECISQPQNQHQKVVGRVWSFRDITKRKRAEATIRYQANHDFLTGLANRRQFKQLLARLMSVTQVADEYLAVLFIDLDRFKLVNDSFGHAIGDRLLQEVVNRLQNCCRDVDTIARWGGGRVHHPAPPPANPLRGIGDRPASVDCLAAELRIRWATHLYHQQHRDCGLSR